MYEADRKFFNADGSVNREAAMAEGRLLRSREANAACRSLAGAVKAAFRRALDVTTGPEARRQQATQAP